jgi:transcriptional regulator with XRE-family HTH domain
MLIEGQAAMTARKFSMDRILDYLSMPVKTKRRVTHCHRKLDNVSMTKDRKTAPSQFVEGLLGRTRQARKGAGYATQADMARAMDMDPATYGKYETRTPLPYYLLPAFCSLTGVSADWFLGIGSVSEASSVAHSKLDLSMLIAAVHDVEEVFSRPGIRHPSPDTAAQVVAWFYRHMAEDDGRHKKPPERDVRRMLRLVSSQ